MIFILYDEKEFNDLNIDIKHDYIEENFINIFPFDNY